MELHIPVLPEEASEYLIVDKSGNYFDGTFGFGGHAAEFLKILNEDAKLIGVDKDKNAFDYSRKKFEADDRVEVFNTSFLDLETIAKVEFIEKFDGIFVDLGVSSFQLDDVDSGFTHRQDAILDLRMDKSKGKPAWEYVNSLSKDELTRIFKEYGELRKSSLLAKFILQKRIDSPIKRTSQLKEIAKRIFPERMLSKNLSKIFQALRIYTNNELTELESFLGLAVDFLKPGGRIVVLSYHSLEDRIVKNKFKYESLDCICPPEYPVCVCEKEEHLKILTKKPLTAGEEEIKKNPRSRSVKLRAAERI